MNPICRNRFNEAAVAAAVAAGFDGAAAAAVAVSNSFLNESDREVKAEPREPSSTNSGNPSTQQVEEHSNSALLNRSLLKSQIHLLILDS